ncbi:GNAT family N-acetyltransferase [Aquamicrobium sp. LC103]|uniref:GNAT family N-acetyltransferase n=1 Tax=Aquamicrobium sp. LC103 TaxID=1120658 RepID=UPI00063E6EA5|nr:GNAT family N-acetyltransferase [Aquamicrobium sp. LC103]TKT75238.1 GNAT family N-acetyltransferase [Aquamicrobium sp. LC103]
MAAVPILEELSGSPAGAMIGRFADYSASSIPPSFVEAIETARPPRRLAIYPASAGFDLVEELDFLCARSIEPNIFFNPRFLAPAMPRLEDREVHLAVIRDEDDFRSRLRLLLPFSIEKPAVPLGVTVMRAWSNPFGPLGTPLVDRDDPADVIEDFFGMLARPHLKLPKVFVMPDVRVDGSFAGMLRSLAASRNLPLTVTGEAARPFLESELAGDDYLKAALRPHHFREFRRQKRRLADLGALEYRIARQPEEIRLGIEDFLALETSGWKGRKRTAMAIDRYHAAFVREAAHRMAEQDLCRVHSLILDGRTIAVLVVFVEAGVAYTWKTAYDEDYAAFSPGTLLMVETTKTHLEDPNIDATDSCAIPDHPVMSRLWSERRTFCTFVVGLTPDADRATQQAAVQIHLYEETRNMARQLRKRLRGTG